jgi:hypothetical protein
VQGAEEEAEMSYWGAREEIDAMVGKVLRSVSLENDKGKIVFAFADGSSQSFGVEGDCCSHSWIEHLELPGSIEGATVTGFEEDQMDDTDDPVKNPATEYGREHESLQVYSSRFKTDRGEIVLEYRNSSNGYYGGYLVPA